MTALHKAYGVCEECYTAEEFGEPRPHPDGRCWTAADLMAFPVPRQPPGTPCHVGAQLELVNREDA